MNTLGYALKYNTQLRELYLRNNFIRNITNLCDALKVNDSLICLDLSDNEIIDFNLLWEALKENNSLENLILTRYSHRKHGSEHGSR